MRPRRSRTRRSAIAEDSGSIHGGGSFRPSSVAPPLTAAALGQDRVLGVAQKRKRQAVQPERSAREASGFTRAQKTFPAMAGQRKSTRREKWSSSFFCV